MTPCQQRLLQIRVRRAWWDGQRGAKMFVSDRCQSFRRPPLPMHSGEAERGSPSRLLSVRNLRRAHPATTTLRLTVLCRRRLATPETLDVHLVRVRRLQEITRGLLRTELRPSATLRIRRLSVRFFISAVGGRFCEGIFSGGFRCLGFDRVSMPQFTPHPSA